MDSDNERQERMHQEQALDEALKDTFPASDPISLIQPQRAERHGFDSAPTPGQDGPDRMNLKRVGKG